MHQINLSEPTMSDEPTRAKLTERSALLIALGCYAIVRCITFAIAILIAGFVVSDHNWLVDTISDLGAGKHEFIVDIGIYAF